MKRVAFIPARGGSKRLPRKNIMKFMGKPMISYTIEAALSTSLFERVIVSTEDEEIAQIGEEYGADIDGRSTELATDSSTVKDVCMDFLEREAINGRSYDVLCVLYATAPLRNGNDIKEVVSLLSPGICDFSLAVTQYDLPPHQALKMGADNSLTPLVPELVSERADTVGELRVDNGSTYAVSIPAFEKQQSFYGPNLCGYEMPRNRSVDIDTQEDFDLVTYYAERMK